MSRLLPSLQHRIIKTKGTEPVWEQGSVYRSSGIGVGAGKSQDPMIQSFLEKELQVHIRKPQHGFSEAYLRIF